MASPILYGLFLSTMLSKRILLVCFNADDGGADNADDVAKVCVVLVVLRYSVWENSPIAISPPYLPEWVLSSHLIHIQYPTSAANASAWSLAWQSPSMM